MICECVYDVCISVLDMYTHRHTFPYFCQYIYRHRMGWLRLVGYLKS